MGFNAEKQRRREAEEIWVGRVIGLVSYRVVVFVDFALRLFMATSEAEGE